MCNEHPSFSLDKEGQQLLLHRGIQASDRQCPVPPTARAAFFVPSVLHIE